MKLMIGKDFKSRLKQPKTVVRKDFSDVWNWTAMLVIWTEEAGDGRRLQITPDTAKVGGKERLHWRFKLHDHVEDREDLTVIWNSTSVLVGIYFGEARNREDINDVRNNTIMFVVRKTSEEPRTAPVSDREDLQWYLKQRKYVME